MIIKEYTVTICLKPASRFSKYGFSWDEDKYEVKDLSVGLENDTLLVLINDNFTRVRKKGKECFSYPILGKPSISVYNNDSLYGDAIHYTLYSATNKRPSTIQKEIRAKVKEKFGSFFGDIDLSIIK